MSTLRLFAAYGIELEYMIVDSTSLAVRPVADALMELEAGSPVSDVERGPIAWSNELVLHVLELKTNGPAPELRGLAELFQGEVRHVNGHLASLGARLMPGGMHPLMDPVTEMRLWPHEHNDVYRTFDRIFGCRSHGWANLQSTHVNLPFADDDEFRRLHAAIRVVLPLVPALAAASPYRDGRRSGSLDGRVEVYRTNAHRVPSVTGQVVPEAVTSREAYEAEILGRIHADLAELDPEGVLRHEWVNARGAIPRFTRGSIEIRLIDAQESPRADLAVAAAVVAAVRWLTEDPPAGWEAANAIPTEALAEILDTTIRSGDLATVDGIEYMRLFGLQRATAPAAAIWRHVIDAALPGLDGRGEWSDALEHILAQGCLGRRLAKAIGPEASPDRIHAQYRRLADSLEGGTMYSVDSTAAPTR